MNQVGKEAFAASLRSQSYLRLRRVRKCRLFLVVELANAKGETIVIQKWVFISVGATEDRNRDFVSVVAGVRLRLLYVFICLVRLVE